MKYFRYSGGRIVLRPYLYRRLVVGPRSRRPLRIVGMRGARVERMLFGGARRVSFGRVTIGPIRGDALLEVHESRDIVLHDLVVTARGTRRSSSILVSKAHGVTIRRSNFMHCGDRAREFTNCVTLYRWSHRVLIEDNRFHDCLGCDFIHGRFGTHLTIRRNRFDRSLPCHMSAHRCGHQDLVQLFAGRHLRVVGNRFGVYKSGGAQLYLTNNVDYATIVNNVFAATDPRVPGYRARMGIVVGSNASRRLPHFAKVDQQHDPLGRRAARRVRGLDPDELAVQHRAALEAADRREQRDRAARHARAGVQRLAAVHLQRRRPGEEAARSRIRPGRPISTVAGGRGRRPR